MSTTTTNRSYISITTKNNLKAVVTSPVLPPAPPICGSVPKRTPVTDHDKSPSFIHHTPIVMPTPRPPPHPNPDKPRKVIKEPYKPYRSDHCAENICKQYSKSLQLNKNYFNFKYNKCYCSECYDANEPDSYRVANSIYTVPRGWTRFGLQVDEKFVESRNMFRNWCTTFYGTSKNKLESVLHNRFIPFPGDRFLSGEIFSTHLPDKHHVYTSPSIHYASLKHVCPTGTTKLNNEWYDVQIILECKQNPEGIIKQQGCRRNVCPIISDNEIEWKTDQRSSIIPYGLLIRAKKHECTDKCSIRHS
ncbi:unnamed protein product [Rotaria sordida]|uniref:Uncharacterized protein n=1 Tax=Rotaria sordida TaxID=392033 RepID=A0A815TW77_9BILA|nr:unnamed protein product [Rotaria sordida]